ncbi:hypothetical protein [Acinetobacter baumannii]|jgi:hypothetical protein|uniref:Uncharacterized protein n=1 Tax=Acinetobacter baumannii TaxID=470 RepID=A0A1E3MB14_ACIBA|nr:hypothetical protein [Acinetobacter baumannii]ABO11343.1 hypothetical protein A1S_0911 [Acinetobacter baumannii ATCC 17978]AKQ27787.1 hypothetical protein ACX60_13830 [Acinetobacter baumannii]APP31446.1 hypothetical protein AUO97_11760 [Acinetobacter baumannii]APX49914.1 hypothetical protein AT570_11755 [Acinetobacter baumannii]EHU1525525.1 hypothetical protein [Acinetobacter baumannii]
MKSKIYLVFILFFSSLTNSYADEAKLALSNISGSNQALAPFEKNKLENLNKEELLSIILKQDKSIDDINKKYESLKLELASQKEANTNLEFPVWISIVLGCVAILVTVLGVIVAILSIFGYQKIKDSATKIAEEKTLETATTVAKDVVNDQLQGIASTEVARLIAEGELREELERAVDMILRRNRDTQNATGFNKYPELD